MLSSLSRLKPRVPRVPWARQLWLGFSVSTSRISSALCPDTLRSALSGLPEPRPGRWLTVSPCGWSLPVHTSAALLEASTTHQSARRRLWRWSHRFRRFLLTALHLCENSREISESAWRIWAHKSTLLGPCCQAAQTSEYVPLRAHRRVRVSDVTSVTKRALPSLPASARGFGFPSLSRGTGATRGRALPPSLRAVRLPPNRRGVTGVRTRQRTPAQ